MTPDEFTAKLEEFRAVVSEKLSELEERFLSGAAQTSESKLLMPSTSLPFKSMR